MVLSARAEPVASGGGISLPPRWELLYKRRSREIVNLRGAEVKRETISFGIRNGMMVCRFLDPNYLLLSRGGPDLIVARGPGGLDAVATGAAHSQMVSLLRRLNLGSDGGRRTNENVPGLD